jgi:FkbM family methyltransferase
MKQYCIYGIGALGQKITDLILLNNDDVISIYEGNPKISDYKNIQVLPIVDLKNEHKNITFIIGIWNPNIDLGQLKSELQNMGISKVLYAGELTNYYNFEHYLFASKDFISKNEKKIEFVKNLLRDKKSVELFTRLVELRRENNFDINIELDERQYFPKDIPEITELNWNSHVYLDLGAFNGDTLLDLIKYAGEIKYYYGVEPDDINADLLQQTIVDNNINGEVLRVASGNKNETVFFMQGGGVSSKVLDAESDATKAVQMVRFDDYILKCKPTIIKMDIEGAEKETLLGLKKTIEVYKPILMVCLYHTKDDLWELPILIHEIRNDYKFYIRQHYPNGLETVLYCV